MCSSFKAHSDISSDLCGFIQSLAHTFFRCTFVSSKMIGYLYTTFERWKTCRFSEVGLGQQLGHFDINVETLRRQMHPRCHTKTTSMHTWQCCASLQMICKQDLLPWLKDMAMAQKRVYSDTKSTPFSLGIGAFSVTSFAHVHQP